MNTLLNVCNTAMLLVVICGCLFYLNKHSDATTPWCQQLGFVLTGAGALAIIISIWKPALSAVWPTTVLNAGMFFIVLATCRGDFRAALALAQSYYRARRIAHLQFRDFDKRRGE